MVPFLPLVGFGAVGLGVLLVSSTAQAAPAPLQEWPALNETPQPNWKRRILERTSSHEGGYGAQNRNWDGAGLSYGLIQWTQKHGNLGRLLRKMQQADPAAFARIFGAAAGELLAVTNAGSEAARLAPVAGAPLWAEPWTARFTAAGKHGAFQAAQRQMALTGDHWKGAVKTARVFSGGVNEGPIITERSMSLFFDTSVQQGPGDATRIASEVHTALTASGAVRIDYFTVLTAYAQACCDRVRRLQPNKPAERGTWRQVAPGEWHKVIGKNFDYYEDYRKRRFGIVWDPDLSDTPVSLGPTTV